MTRTLTAYSAVTTGKLRKHLFGGNRFSTIRLGNRKEQFSFLLRRQREAAVAISGQDRHRRLLFQRHALDYDLTADDLSSSDLHSEKNTPIHERRGLTPNRELNALNEVY